LSRRQAVIYFDPVQAELVLPGGNPGFKEVSYPEINELVLNHDMRLVGIPRLLNTN
jgi:hypothetical protein